MTASRQRTLITILIVIGSVIVGFFGWRTLHAFREFRGHRPPPPFAPDAAQVETDVELIRDWMTIPFISRMYQVHPNVFLDELKIPPDGNRDKSLKELNDEYYPQTDGIVLEKIKAAILANQPLLPSEAEQTSIAPATAVSPQP